MRKTMKKAIALLLVLAALTSLCACGNQSDTESNPQDSTIKVQNELLMTELSEALILSDGVSILDMCSDEIFHPAAAYAATYKAANYWRNTQAFYEWEQLNDQNEQCRLLLAQDEVSDETDRAAQVKEYYAALNDLGSGAAVALNCVTPAVGREYADYCINNMLGALESTFGIDEKSADEVIWEKMQLLDDIYTAAQEIEKTANKINQNLEVDDVYYTCMENRTSALKELSYATCQKYNSVVAYLKDGYEDYLHKSEIYNTLTDKKSDTDDYFQKALQVSFDEDFYFKRAFMNGEETLSNYMQYMLMYCGDEARDIINTWAQQTINENSMCMELKNLLASYTGEASADGKTFPEIYDYCAYRIYPWEHLGYDFREGLRISDALILSTAYTMADLYYTLFTNAAETKTVQQEQKALWNLVTAYNAVQNSQTVVHHDNYYICQIEGCEYVFAKTPVYFDYYSQLRNHLDSCEFEKENNDMVPQETAEALSALFYDRNVAYRYDELTEVQQSNCTFDHAAIGTAGDPFGQVDWNDVSTFATVYNDDEAMLYLPQSAYIALYNYYASNNTNSLYAILEKELGMTFAEDTKLVCDVGEEKNFVERKKIPRVHIYYCGAFCLTQNERGKNNDYMDIGVCLKENPAELQKERFADKLSVKTTVGSSIGIWGEATNRFAGLMVLGVQNSRLYA